MKHYRIAIVQKNLPALRRSIKEGVDFAEVDVRFTADGVVTNKPLMWKDWAALIRKERG